ncbi:MAG: RluA family pseudouridine synthase [Verrucomicrobiota bacterium]
MDEAIQPGPRQEVLPGRDDLRLFRVLHEDGELLVINKPAGLVCHPTKGDVYSSLISRVRLYLGPTATPQLINRLDRETSGLVLVAKTPHAARAARRIWESRSVEKDYWAIVHGFVPEDHLVINAPLGKDEASPVAIKDTVRPDGTPALTECWVSRRFRRGDNAFTSLRVRPHTGRKHQIRIHLAANGHPVVGDKLYGLDEAYYLALVRGALTDQDWARLILPFHALHAREIRLTWAGIPVRYCAEPEDWFLTFLENQF